MPCYVFLPQQKKEKNTKEKVYKLEGNWCSVMTTKGREGTISENIQNVRTVFSMKYLPSPQENLKMITCWWNAVGDGDRPRSKSF